MAIVYNLPVAKTEGESPFLDWRCGKVFLPRAAENPAMWKQHTNMSKANKRPAPALVAAAPARIPARAAVAAPARIPAAAPHAGPEKTKRCLVRWRC